MTRACAHFLESYIPRPLGSPGVFLALYLEVMMGMFIGGPLSGASTDSSESVVNVIDSRLGVTRLVTYVDGVIVAEQDL